MDKEEWKTWMTGVLDQVAMYISEDCTPWDLGAISMAIGYLCQSTILLKSIDQSTEERIALAEIFEAQSSIIVNEMIDRGKFNRRLFNPADWGISDDF